MDVVKFSPNSSMNDRLPLNISNLYWVLFKGLLVWDAYKCHTSDSTRSDTKKLKIHTAVVLGGCTNFIQAPDVVWNSCFKSHLRSSYDCLLVKTRY